MSGATELADLTTRPEHVRHQHSDELEAPILQQSLEPADGGLSAWKFLLAAFMIEAVFWGFPLSFGVFQNYYGRLPQFANSPYITYIGTISTGLAFFGAPLIVALNRRFPQHQRKLIWLGYPICVAGLVFGSFADSIAGLVLTQGVMYGAGYGLVFYPIISMMNEWWVARRGLAWGIMIGSSGASGVVFPFILEKLLDKYGYKTSLRALAVAMVVLTAPLLPFLRGRLPISQSSNMASSDWSFLRKPLFWLYTLSTITQSLGFYLPSLYLPSYVSALGLGSTKGALLLALMSVAQVFGQFIYGYLSDGRIPLNALVLSTSVVGAVSAFTLWGLAGSFAPLVCFGLIYGFFAYSFLAMRVRMGTAVTTDSAAAMEMFCAFSFTQGIGNILSGPISGALLIPGVDSKDYGHLRFKAIVLFTGCCMAASACTIGACPLLGLKAANRQSRGARA